jgi:hypothetical protein
MKVKLTLWVKKSAIEAGKLLAARHGTSLSHLVEHILVDLPQDDAPASRRRWWENYERAHPIGGPAQCDLNARLP